MSAALLILTALGLWLVLEGLVSALAPDLMKQVGAWLAKLDTGEIRQAGLVSVALGLFLVYIAIQFR